MDQGHGALKCYEFKIHINKKISQWGDPRADKVWRWNNEVTGDT